MTRYYSSDWHLGHARILTLCDRPFKDVDHMDSAIIDNINSTLDPTEDDLIILGDTCMGNMDKSLRNLARVQARRIMLIPGNHDRWSLAFHTRGDHATKREIWRKRYEEVFPEGVALAMADRTPSVWRTGVGEVHAWMSHYPSVGDSYGEDRYLKLRMPIRPGFLINGHVHNAWQTRGRQFNVGVDVNGFKPVSEDTLRDWMDSEIEKVSGTRLRATIESDMTLPRGLRPSRVEVST